MDVRAIFLAALIDSLGVPPAVPHEVGEAAQLQSVSVAANEDVAFVSFEEVPAVGTEGHDTFGVLDGRHLGDVRVGVRTAVRDGAEGVDRTVDAAVLHQLEPGLLAVRQLAQAFLQHEVFSQSLSRWVGQGRQDVVVDGRFAVVGELLRLPPVQLLQPVGDVHAAGGVEHAQLDAILRGLWVNRFVVPALLDDVVDLAGDDLAVLLGDLLGLPSVDLLLPNFGAVLAGHPPGHLLVDQARTEVDVPWREQAEEAVV